MGSECSRKPVSLQVESRFLKPNFASTRHDFQTRIFKSSQAIRVENQVLLKLLRHQRLRASQLDLVIHLVLQLHLVARHVGLPAFNPCLGVPEGRRIISFLQFSPSLPRVLPRVGDNVIRFKTRKSHERCMHLPGLSQSARIRDR